MHKAQNYTVESVTNGHPDKVCDQISDAILDECLKQDAMSRVAIETFGAHGLLVIGGELTSKAKIDPIKIARQVYSEIGYSDRLDIVTKIVQQSPDIAQGVNTGGAGDQGIMYGYATDETEDYLPFGLGLVHQLTKGLADLRTNGYQFLLPDGKAQITVENKKITTILISTQHTNDVSQEFLSQFLTENLIKKVIGDINDIKILINPTGIFLQGGFEADTGLTGRKIMVDTYGGLYPHGGGAFSGKDSSKVDRSAAYMCRFVAKNLVADALAKEALVSVAYAIGEAQPLMIEAVNEKGESLAYIVKEKFDFRPKAIIERLNLRQPIFRVTATYGHFGHSNYPWEQITNI
ncbi:methionine adenosyltransferase [Candidatus Falkowbacteria bacterium CG10_big_fil_rev_8_21_14_0_10_39_11]|uniref:Methionine adenosyltransferase n=1 Tax=Candidatus Falkowbacteria bacterium CG10_big_fil_rev_8_21_14_0_10_39_11 TaxID=1974565 RepID=A0A2H0V3N9_9BACT|nr:MAG: methionine adenosyltransferase [Candidatus Falkowbacteria bacterium CG10_big_fil_rev_8_21_14_0_10_39_11]